MDVPPTLCAFAVCTGKAFEVISPELKKAGNILVQFQITRDQYDLPDYNQVISLYHKITKQIHEKVIRSAYAVGAAGITEAVSKMAFGNKLGFQFSSALSMENLFREGYGSIIAEIDKEDLPKLSAEDMKYDVIGTIQEDSQFVYKKTSISMKETLDAWTSSLEDVFATRSGIDSTPIKQTEYKAKKIYICKHKIAKPKVFFPVFPGTNCEYDTIQSFENAGADTECIVFRNMTKQQIKDSAQEFEKAIKGSQILMFSGGFSAGDEPDGSAKFIASVFRNEKIKESVHDLLNQRDGLILGICNGFQALIKLGLVPNGEITGQKADSPTLTTNRIGRHVSKSVYTKVASNMSPWLQKAELGGVYTIPASHGEGRFVANDDCIKSLINHGQIATQYVDLNHNPTMDEEFNPNGSYYAIEGITSEDGRVFGKMCHSERRGKHVAINIHGEQDQKIFESGVEYFQ
jgi:phosphoribosylformylglycinamidine synthase